MRGKDGLRSGVYACGGWMAFKMQDDIKTTRFPFTTSPRSPRVNRQPPPPLDEYTSRVGSSFHSVPSQLVLE